MGELFGIEGLMGHEFSLSDDVLQVPMVLRHPSRIRAGHTVELPVSHLDIVPTVLDFVGASEAAATLEGSSLLAAENLSPERPLIAEHFEPRTLIGRYWASRHPEFDTEPFAVSLLSLRKGSNKLVENSRGEVALSGGALHAIDDNSPAREDLAREMREELTHWIARLSPAK